MRTTLDLDNDVLASAKSLAKVRQLPLGRVISDLARQALHAGGQPRTLHGVPLFPRSEGQVCVTLELVNQLRDDTL